MPRHLVKDSNGAGDSFDAFVLPLPLPGRVGLNRALGHTGLGPMFASTRCADESVSKPAPDMVLELMDELSHAPERTLVIGDTTHDLLMARHAGCEAVAVSYGAHPLHELLDAAPRAHAASVAELTEWLRCHA